MCKSIFISGGSKGIGLAIAQKFFQEGFQVGICARGKAGLEKATEMMPGIYTFECDIADKAQVMELGKTVLEKMGPLTILVNNGGVFMPGGVHDATDEAYEKMVATNLHSAFYLTRTLVPTMIQQKKGTIFNLCSVASIMAYPNGGLYSITKFALLGYSKSLREELKTHNIRVISVLPGAVYTASWEGANLPEERFIPAADIASL